MEFYVNLIVINEKQSEKALENIKINCIHICNNVYTMEGDVNCLVDEGVDFNLIEEIIVGCLGDLSEKALIKICNDSSVCDVTKLKYNENDKYIELIGE